MHDKWIQWICKTITFSFLLALIGASSANAQFGSIRNATNKAQEELRKKKEADAKKESDAKNASDTQEQPASASPADSPGQKAAAAAPAEPADATPAVSFQAFSKYDFVPGEKIVAIEDFMQDSIGDFPAKWNTDASGEVVTIAGQTERWLKLSGGGFFTPEFVKTLPDNFTLEFDVMTNAQFNSSYRLIAVLAELPSPSPAGWRGGNNNFSLIIRPGLGGDGSSSTELRQNGTSAPANVKDAPQFKKGAPMHVAIWRQRARVRVYLNEDKAWDIARALTPESKLNSILFVVPGVEANSEYYLANIRLAVGAPDTRNKLLTEGKWVTHGILFDVNSDRVKPESYGALKEIAGVLQESADLKVQIVGHTDSDGDDAKNLDLSKRRAASVRAALMKEFSIDGARMETDGKGETQPVDKNDTAAGKANNRRVEFIKK